MVSSKIVVSKKRIPAGDYCFKGYSSDCLVERKGSTSEIWKNLFSKDRVRFHKAWKKFVESTAHPVLLLDMPVAGSFIPHPEYSPAPRKAFDFLLRKAARDGVTVLWLPTASSVAGARRCGEIVLRTMWNYVLLSKKLI
jgi:hypothetical protein